MTVHGPAQATCRRCKEREPVRVMKGSGQWSYYCGECTPSQVRDLPRLEWLPGHEPPPEEAGVNGAVAPPAGLTPVEAAQWYRDTLASLTDGLLGVVQRSVADSLEWEQLAEMVEHDSNGHDGSEKLTLPEPVEVAPSLMLDAETALGEPRCMKLVGGEQCRRVDRHHGHHTANPPRKPKPKPKPLIVKRAPYVAPAARPPRPSAFAIMMDKVATRGKKTNKMMTVDKRAKKEWLALKQPQRDAVERTLLLSMARPPKVRMNKMTQFGKGKNVYAWRVGNSRLRIIVTKVAGGWDVDRIVDRADRDFYHGEHN